MIEIPVKGPKGEKLVALIDDADYELAGKYKWVAGGRSPENRSWFYAYASNPGPGVRRNILMHRLIMGAKPGTYVDHINGNHLDNRRQNLRFCTRSENMRNRIGPNSGRKFKGVYRASKNRFRAMIGLNHKLKHLGTYKTELEAARAYDEAAIRLHGEFASLNFPLEKKLPADCKSYLTVNISV